MQQNSISKLLNFYDINLLYFSNDRQHHVTSSRLTQTIFLHEAEIIHLHHVTTCILLYADQIETWTSLPPPPGKPGAFYHFMWLESGEFGC